MQDKGTSLFPIEVVMDINHNEPKAERWDEFGRNYEDSESTEIGLLVVAAGSFLERLVGNAEAVGAVMQQLAERLRLSGAGTRPWRETWESISVGDVETAGFFVSLNAFAFYGLPLDPQFTNNLAMSEDVITTAINRGRELVDSVPEGWGDVTELQRTVLAAEARRNLDFDRGVSIDQLSALARMAPKSLRNLLTPKSGDGDLRVDEHGVIAASVALRWIKKRDNFKSSVWMTVAADGPVYQPDTETIDEVLFVPVAKDGSTFDPVTCRSGGGYTIGPKGAEQKIEGYFDALAILAKASTPFWRRPNAHGNRGIVTGVSWIRLDAAEIHKALKEIPE
jgi:hypothetical protein